MRSLVVMLACLTSNGRSDQFADRIREDDRRPQLRELAKLLFAVNPSLVSRPQISPVSSSSRANARNAGVHMVQRVGLSARPTQASETVLAEEVPVIPASPDEEYEFLPIYPKIERMEGAKTVRTYQMPIWADRAQYMMRSSDGRPLRASVNLWIGPIRQVHTCKVDTEKGGLYPIQGTIKFKKLAPVLKITTDEELSYPIDVAVVVPDPDRSKQLEQHFMDVWRSATHPVEKQAVQGGTIGEGANGWGGSVRTWTFPPGVESVQVLGWSGDVGKKSFKMDVEVLQGVNNVKQKYFFQCGGSTQPYHAIIQIPKEGCVIRMRNKKFIEDGKVEFAIVPYKMRDYSASDFQASVTRW